MPVPQLCAGRLNASPRLDPESGPIIEVKQQGGSSRKIFVGMRASRNPDGFPQPLMEEEP